MRRLAYGLMNAAFLGLTLNAGVARGDCCDPPTVVSTSYRPTAFSSTTLVPTAFVAPTVIEPTVYVESPMVLQPTSYVVEATERRGLLDRIFGSPTTSTRTVYDYRPTSFVEVLPTTYATTTYVPTSYTTTAYTPTSSVVQGPLISTLDPCAVVTSLPVVRAQPQSATPSQPTGAAPRPLEGTGAGLNSGSAETKDRAEPGLDRSATGAGDRDDFGLPAGPADDPPVPPLDDATSRTALRPAATEMKAMTSATPAGALRGTVVSATDGQAKADVKVVFTDARQTYRDRERTTDSSGRFEVMLPNGDWTVNVQETDGRLTPFGTVTSTSGRFLDDRDRIVSSLRLNH